MPSFQVNAKQAALSEILPSLCISGVSALKPEELLNLGISCVINCTAEVPNLPSLPPCVQRIKLWLDDTEDTEISPFFHMISDRIELIRRGGGRCLVHCVAGVSRSAAFCLAYLLKYHNRSLRDAYHFLAARRDLVRPNLGFWRQLITFEAELKGRTSVRIIENSIGTEVQQIPDVYLPIVIPADDKENQTPVQEGRERKGSGAKAKFIPILAPLPEVEH